MPQRPKRLTTPKSTAPRYTPPHLIRPTAARRGYDARWQKARLSFLADHPLCVECEKRGLTVAATVVDHITPHKGDQELFWSVENWRALCERCHNSATAKYDGGGGRPVTPKP
jgi:5-methylcytosine-specific restriction protein A